MEINANIYNWLRTLRVLSDEPVTKVQQKGKVRFAKENSNLFYNGVVFQRIICKDDSLFHDPDIKVLFDGKTIKNEYKLATRIKNWDILIPALFRGWNIAIDSYNKALILKKRQDVLNMLITDFYSVMVNKQDLERSTLYSITNPVVLTSPQHNPSSPSSSPSSSSSSSSPPDSQRIANHVVDKNIPMRSSPPGLTRKNDKLIQYQLQLQQAEVEFDNKVAQSGSIDELLLFVTSTKLNLDPSKTKELLSGAKHKVLCYILQNGIHGNYQLVLEWLSVLYKHTKLIAFQLLQAEATCNYDYTVVKLFNLLFNCLYSSNFYVVKTTCKVFSRVAYSLLQHVALGGSIELLLCNWFISSPVITRLLELWRRFPQLQTELFSVLDLCCRSQLDVLFNVLDSVVSNRQLKLSFLAAVIPLLGECSETRQLVIERDVVGYCVALCEEQAEELYLPLATALYCHFPCQVARHEAVADRLVDTLKRHLHREEQFVLQSSAVAALFQVLRKTTGHKDVAVVNRNVVIYKTLVFHFLTHYDNQLLRQLLRLQFIAFFKEAHHCSDYAVLVDILLAPFLKQLDCNQLDMQATDLALLAQLASYSHFDISACQTLFSFLCHVLLNGSTALVHGTVQLLTQLADAFHKFPILVEKLVQFAHFLLQQAVNDTSQSTRAHNAEMLTFELLRKLLALRHQAISQQLVYLLHDADEYHVAKHGMSHYAIKTLLQQPQCAALLTPNSDLRDKIYSVDAASKRSFQRSQQHAPFAGPARPSLGLSFSGVSRSHSLPPLQESDHESSGTPASPTGGPAGPARQKEEEQPKPMPVLSGHSKSDGAVKRKKSKLVFNQQLKVKTKPSAKQVQFKPSKKVTKSSPISKHFCQELLSLSVGLQADRDAAAELFRPWLAPLRKTFLLLANQGDSAGQNRKTFGGFERDNTLMSIREFVFFLRFSALQPVLVRNKDALVLFNRAAQDSRHELTFFEFLSCLRNVLLCRDFEVVSHEQDVLLRAAALVSFVYANLLKRFMMNSHDNEFSYILKDTLLITHFERCDKAWLEQQPRVLPNITERLPLQLVGRLGLVIHTERYVAPRLAVPRGEAVAVALEVLDEVLLRAINTHLLQSLSQPSIQLKESNRRLLINSHSAARSRCTVKDRDRDKGKRVEQRAKRPTVEPDAKQVAFGSVVKSVPIVTSPTVKLKQSTAAYVSQASKPKLVREKVQETKLKEEEHLKQQAAKKEKLRQMRHKANAKRLAQMAKVKAKQDAEKRQLQAAQERKLKDKAAKQLLLEKQRHQQARRKVEQFKLQRAPLSEQQRQQQQARVWSADFREETKHLADGIFLSESPEPSPKDTRPLLNEQQLTIVESLFKEQHEMLAQPEFIAVTKVNDLGKLVTQQLPLEEPPRPSEEHAEGKGPSSKVAEESAASPKDPESPSDQSSTKPSNKQFREVEPSSEQSVEPGQPSNDAEPSASRQSVSDEPSSDESAKDAPTGEGIAPSSKELNARKAIEAADAEPSNEKANLDKPSGEQSVKTEESSNDSGPSSRDITSKQSVKAEPSVEEITTKQSRKQSLKDVASSKDITSEESVKAEPSVEEITTKQSRKQSLKDVPSNKDITSKQSVKAEPSVEEITTKSPGDDDKQVTGAGAEERKADAPDKSSASNRRVTAVNRSSANSSSVYDSEASELVTVNMISFKKKAALQHLQKAKEMSAMYKASMQEDGGSSINFTEADIKAIKFKAFQELQAAKMLKNKYQEQQKKRTSVASIDG